MALAASPGLDRYQKRVKVYELRHLDWHNTPAGIGSCTGILINVSWD
jgi:hypothetical protein